MQCLFLLSLYKEKHFWKNNLIFLKVNIKVMQYPGIWQEILTVTALLLYV